MTQNERDTIGLYLKLLKLKIQNDPKNPILQTIQAAIQSELKGNKKEALKLYLRCGDDGFVKGRIEALSPLKFAPVPSSSPKLIPKLKQLLSTEEYALFRAINKLIQNKRTLTRDALRTMTGFSKALVYKIMERLQDKGYLSKLQRRYRHTNIVKQPVIREGRVGTLPEAEQPLVPKAPRVLVFSPMTRRLYTVEQAPQQEVLRPRPAFTPPKLKI